MQPTMASVVQLVEAAKATAVEVTKKLGELPTEPFPEPYPWQVGDEINPGNGDRILVVQHVQDGLVKFCGEACTNTQADLEKFGCTIHRKATETAPESYDWQVGDEIEDDGGVRRPVTDRDAKGWVFIKGIGALPQFEWELRRWKLHRKAGDLPDLPPFTEQQVAEFAALTEPIDDSVGTDGEGQS
jgi:hypothetical protein